jgi:hypothetical protein
MYNKHSYTNNMIKAWTLAGFRAWCEANPNPFQKGESPRYYQNLNFFLSLERVRGVGLFNKYDFIGKTLRVYQDKPSDWVLPSGKESDDELIEKYFPGVIEEYEREIYGE